ncbi:MAG: formate acetyltransferase [bacterium]|nr:formate acetyltransferase [bacterium]
MASATNILAANLLRLMAANFKHRSSLNKYLKSDEGWINFSVGFRTENRTVEASVRFHEGSIGVSKTIPANIDVTLIFADETAVKEMLNSTPSDVLNMLLKSRMRTEGNMAILSLFNFYISLLMGKRHKKMAAKQKKKANKALNKEAKEAKKNQPDNNLPGARKNQEHKTARVRKERLRGEPVDKGVKHLEDPYLSAYSLEDFPRLREFLDIHFTVQPDICHERAELLTDWYKEHGFEHDNTGAPWNPELRNARAYNSLMKNREPKIRANDLLAGTTTSKEIGVVIYPDAHGTLIWGELNSASYRELNPYTISPETISVLHHKVFPFWAKRNFREWVRETHNNPLSQRMDERFAVYFLWKTVSLSHTIADFPKLLKLGTRGMIEEIRRELQKKQKSSEKENLLRGMILCLEGVTAYAKNLSEQARNEAEKESDPERKRELRRLADICARVPENPARTLDEAVNAVWIGWIGLHMENTNAGLSLGRMDQWLQPYFEKDMKKIKSAAKKEACIRYAIELIGSFYMRCTDHLPLIPDIGNYLFGGSSSDQVITLGGITPSGGDAVNDMTYIFLKVTELLGIRDPNVNARYDARKNSDTYLKRLCEVNLITAATPSMHNDEAVMASLAEFKFKKAHLRDWSATGCVEPTLSGKHMGHTNCMMMNMVAALEMALYNGRHPLMNWEIGEKTGSPEREEFKSFEEFFAAFSTHFGFLIDNAVDYNNKLGEAHGALRPSPLLSSLIEGPLKNGKDLTRGGAVYNTSGAACIGLADITDSLLAVKQLVFDEKRVSFREIKEAVVSNFENNPALHALVTRKVPLFGSGSEEAVAMANRVAKLAHDRYAAHTNYRGGPYTAGFWSMSNHVAFGTLTGALPSGRLSAKAFTPGLTPEPHASKDLLNNIRDVAALKPEYMNNNIAFNVKVVPGVGEAHGKIVDTIFSYVKSYFALGGMQMQLNVLDSGVMRDAMLHPELYRDLLVRISGYNAYFVTLNRDMQIELIERAEYGI